MLSVIAITAAIVQGLACILLMLYLTESFPFQKDSVSIRSIILILLSIVLIHLIQTYDNTNIHLGAFITFFQYFIIVRVISHAPVRNVMTAIFMAYMITTLAQLPPLFLVICLDSSFNPATPSLSLLFIIICNALLLLPCIHFLPLKTLYKKILGIPSFVLVSILFVFTLLGVMSYFFHGVSAPRGITLICSILFLFLAFGLFLFFALRTQKKEQALHYYETYLPILDDMILNIRKTQHNHNNTIQSIASLPQSYTDYRSLTGALKRYSSYMAKDAIPTQFLHFENKLLAALLYNKYCLAVEKNIPLNITIHNHFYDSRLTEFQIVDLCGILLDNALEASQENDTLFVEIGASRQTGITPPRTPFAVTVKNPGPEVTQDFIHKIFSAGYTSKEDAPAEHGIGLAYIKSLVQRQHGYIEVSNEMIPQDNTKQARQYFVIHVSV